MPTDRRVRIAPKGSSMKLSGVLEPLTKTGNAMMFPYTPTITWNGSVNYSQMQIVHSLQDYYFFANSASSVVTVTGKFSAMNEDEANYTYACMHFLRSVTKMGFGKSTNLGLPPPVLTLDAYGDVMNALNCVCKDYNIDMPDNVDYVPVPNSGPKVWIPTLTTITVNLILQNTPTFLSTFDFDKFASGGDLKGWF